MRWRTRQPITSPLQNIGERSWLPAAVLIGLTLVFYHGLWLPDLVLIKRDAFRFYLPLKQYLIERLSAGELPQWFPYEALGRSFIGVAHTGAFHPFTALSFVFSISDAYRASTLISCLLAALGTYALGRALNFSPLGACLAGLSFVLSGYVVSLTDSLLYLYSICLLPLFCLALDNALTKNLAWTIVPAALWATVFLIGDIQTGYYYAFIALAWVVARAPGSYREAGLRLVLAGALAALLAGIQLGPAWAVFTGSERVQPALFHEQVLHWATPPLRLVTILAGPVGEHALTNDPAAEEAFYDVLQERAFGFFYTNYFWAESLYLGVPVVGLAILGSWWRRDLRVLALLGCLALLLSLGRLGGLHEIFSHVVPFWSAFRYPEKFMGIVAFASAMLAGAGLDALRSGHGRSWPWLTAMLLFATIGVALRTEAASAWVVTSLGAPDALAHEITGSTGQAFLFSALTAMGVAMVILGFNRSTFRRGIWLALLAAIIALDLSRVNLSAYHTAPSEAATFTPPMVEALRAQEGALAPGRFRMVTLVETLVAIPERLERTLGHSTAVIVARRQALAALHNAEFHIETAKRYLPGYKSELVAMFKQGIGPQAAARYNVAYYIGLRSHLSEARLPGAPVAELPDYDLVLFRNPIPVKPRAYLAQHPERSNAPVDPAALLARPEFLSGEVDVIETTDSTLPGPSLNGTATIERYRPEEVRVRVDTPQPAVLILLDAFDDGWKATLDNGHEVPILRANVLVRAVVVPAGRHAVTFSYHTPFLKIGAWASLAGVLLCTGLLVQTRRRTHRRNARA